LAVESETGGKPSIGGLNIFPSEGSETIEENTGLFVGSGRGGKLAGLGGRSPGRSR